MSRSDISPEIQEVIETTARTVVQRLLLEQSAAESSGSRLLSVKETCVFLSCSRATLHRLKEAGVLVPMRFGRKVIYDRVALEAYIQKAGMA